MADVLKVITPVELARDLDPILDSLDQSGNTVIVRRHDQPAALLVRFDAYVAMLATMDYSGWERFLEEVRAVFPKAPITPPRRSRP
jgi:PHD/YefM family antitoxin component YafN of YafNO toxin-antitoxin module